MSAVMNQPRLQFRPMEEGDLDQVMAIEERVYPFCWTRNIFQDCLRVGYACRVLESEEGITGYGILSYGAGEAHVLNIAIHPDLQGRGLGRALLEHLLEQAKRLNAEAVFLEVRPSNLSALHLYESAGFNQVGHRRNYYPTKNGREDALIFARQLF